MVDEDIKPELLRCLGEKRKLRGFFFPSATGALVNEARTIEKTQQLAALFTMYASFLRVGSDLGTFDDD